MAYSISIGLVLGAGYPSATLGARGINKSGTQQFITDQGFSNRTEGNYLWTKDDLPDNFQGAVEFGLYSGGTLTKVLTIVAVNPADAGPRYLMSELSPGVPSATPTVEAALMLLYMALRNRMDTTATELKFYNDNGSVIARAPLTDDGNLFRRDELVNP